MLSVFPLLFRFYVFLRFSFVALFFLCMYAQTVSIRDRAGNQIGTKSIDEVVEFLADQVKTYK